MAATDDADWQTQVTSLAAGKLGIGPAIIDHQFVIRGVTFVRWFVELSREEQIDDIQSVIKLASELSFLFKAGGVYSLADFQEAISAVEAPNRDGFVFIKP